MSVCYTHQLIVVVALYITLRLRADTPYHTVTNDNSYTSMVDYQLHV